jgi:hypothetical protein
MKKIEIIENIEKELNILSSKIPDVRFGLDIKNFIEAQIKEHWLNNKDQSRGVHGNFYYLENNKIYLDEAFLIKLEKEKVEYIQNYVYTHKLDERSINLSKKDKINIQEILKKDMDKYPLFKSIADVIKIEHIIVKFLAITLHQDKLIYQYEFEHELGKRILSELSHSMTQELNDKIMKYGTKSMLDRFLLKDVILDKTRILARSKIFETPNIAEVLFLVKLKNFMYLLTMDKTEKTFKPSQLEYKWKKEIDSYCEKEEMNYNDIFIILNNKMLWFMRVLGKEITSILILNKFIEVNLHHMEDKKRKPLLKINLSSFNVNIGMVAPSFIPQRFFDTNAYYRTDKEILTVTGNKIELKKIKYQNVDSHAWSEPSEETSKLLYKTFDTAYSLDFTNTLNILQFFNILFNTPIAKLEPMHFQLLSDLFGIDFLFLKKNITEKAWTNLITFLCDFSAKRKMHDRDIELNNFVFLKIIYDRVFSHKLIFNNIFCNLAINLRIDRFYNNYFLDFRGRHYPTGTFHYLSPKARFFLSFAYEDALSFNEFFKKKPKDIDQIKQLLIIQLESFLVNDKNPKDNDQNKQKLHSLLNNRPYPHPRDLLFMFKPGQLFYCIKLIRDLKDLNFPDSTLKVNSYRNLSFCAFYSLDASSSGLQIFSLMFRDKDLASKTNLYAEDHLFIDSYKLLADEIYSKISQQDLAPIYEHIQTQLPWILKIDYNSFFIQPPKETIDPKELKTYTFMQTLHLVEDLLDKHFSSFLNVYNDPTTNSGEALRQLRIKYWNIFLTQDQHQLIVKFFDRIGTTNGYNKKTLNIIFNAYFHGDEDELHIAGLTDLSELQAHFLKCEFLFLLFVWKPLTTVVECCKITPAKRNEQN